jgi:hypothetical protein
MLKGKEKNYQAQEEQKKEHCSWQQWNMAGSQ